MTHPLAALIAGLTEHRFLGDGRVFYSRDDVLAALEAAPVPDLVEAAGKVLERPRLFSNLTSHEAADTIRALIALATAQAAQIAGLEAALVKINVGEGWAAQIARKALKEAGHEPS